MYSLCRLLHISILLGGIAKSTVEPAIATYVTVVWSVCLSIFTHPCTVLKPWMKWDAIWQWHSCSGKSNGALGTGAKPPCFDLGHFC